MSATSMHSRVGQQDVDQDIDEPEDESWRGTAGSSLGALPWWITSAALHAVLILLTMLIVMGSKLTAKLTEDVPHAKIVTEPPKKEKPVIRHKVKSQSQVNIEAEAERPFYTPEKLEVSESEVETENEERSEFPARGHQDAVSTIPAEGTGTIGFFGVGSGGAAGSFGWRTGGGRRRRAMRFGGSERTEKSVDLGLEWLKWHQEPDGKWERVKWIEGKHVLPNDVGTPDNVGVTGLALLAFLGAGHTERHGEYKKIVQNGVKWLIENQSENGRWGTGLQKQMYRNAIGTMALSEAAGMAKIPNTVQAAQKAVDGLTSAQRDYEAWFYFGKDERKHRPFNDTSITVWAAMALKSAKVSGLRVSGSAFEGILKWIDHAQDLTGAKPGDYNYEGGRTYYRGKINEPMGPNANGSYGQKKTTDLLTAAGGVIRVFWGQEVTHPGIVGPCNILLKEALPTTERRKTDHYAWYYATLLMFQKGGEHWKKWNVAMQQVLLETQVKGDPKELGGSWNPAGHYESRGGRAFSTALCILSLEVYYRYLPMYGN